MAKGLLTEFAWRLDAAALGIASYALRKVPVLKSIL
jgi:hypothetical protein